MLVDYTVKNACDKAWLDVAEELSGLALETMSVLDVEMRSQ